MSHGPAWFFRKTCWTHLYGLWSTLDRVRRTYKYAGMAVFSPISTHRSGPFIVINYDTFLGEIPVNSCSVDVLASPTSSHNAQRVNTYATRPYRFHCVHYNMLPHPPPPPMHSWSRAPIKFNFRFCRPIADKTLRFSIIVFTVHVHHIFITIILHKHASNPRGHCFRRTFIILYV